MPTLSQASIDGIAGGSAAVAAALGLDAEHTKVLAKVYALAKKNKDPVTCYQELWLAVWRAPFIGMEKQSKAVEAIQNLLAALPEKAGKAIATRKTRASKGASKADAPTTRVAFTPKQHAEFTFRPSVEFREESGSEHEDVGLFLDRGEHVVLDQLKRATKGKQLVITIAEGTVSIIAKAWEEIPAAKAAKLKGKSGVFDRQKIVDEYVG